MSREDKIVSFPTTAEEVPPEERARRLGVEVDRLAGLPMVEWMLYLPDTAKKHGIAQTKLKAMVERTIRKCEKAQAEHAIADLSHSGKRARAAAVRLSPRQLRRRGYDHRNHSQAEGHRRRNNRAGSQR